MGYTTDFSGQFKLDKVLDITTLNLLKNLSETRRMARSGLDEKYGVEGEFFVEGEGFEGDGNEQGKVIDYNCPPKTQPGLWCGWTPTEDGTAIEWNGVEKFYRYIDWITYIIESILKPRGYVLNGEVEWQGEESDDRGMLEIKDNVVKEMVAKITYEEK